MPAPAARHDTAEAPLARLRREARNQPKYHPSAVFLRFGAKLGTP
jgi:hypothetical protein